MSEFLPGDRVRQTMMKFDYVQTVTAVDEDRVWVSVGARFDREWVFPDELTLVSRPVYPEPGQVVVALDAEDVAALHAILHSFDFIGIDQADDRSFSSDCAERVRAILLRAK